MNDPLKCLVVADTFPNRFEPWRGPYNRRQIEELAESCEVTVVNPLPWTRLLSDPRSWALLGREDRVLERVSIAHPLFWHLPVLGRGSSWRGLCRSVSGKVRASASPGCDVIMATFAYPEGAAARRLARRMGVPYIVKARGSDLHSLPKAGRRREMTALALRDAARVVAVSGNLAEIAAELGADPARIHVLPNGIDRDAFAVLPREQARWSLGIPLARKMVVSVGSLLPVKGCDVLMEALKRLRARKAPGAMDLLAAMVGDGPMRGALEKQASRAGLEGSVIFPGHAGREDVALWLNAADALVLPSRNEGCPNVVLEALACGTPVVASRVGAVPDLVDESCGVIVPPLDADALAGGVAEALGREWDRSAIRRRVEGLSWERNASRLHSILTDAVCDFAPARGFGDCLRECAT